MMKNVDWMALSTEELVNYIRLDPTATERDLILAERLAMLIDELGDIEDVVQQLRRRD